MQDDFYSQEIVLENNRVKLIPFGDDVKDELAMMIDDEEITRYTGRHVRTEEDYRKYINSVKQARNSRQGYPFLVIDKLTDQVAGTTRLANLIFESKRLEIGWTWYGKTYRGSGINKACKYELLKYSFEVLHFRRVQFSVDVENVRSQKAVLKLGAKQEGVFRHNYIDTNGESRDDVYFSVIRPEWDQMKSTIFSEFVT